MLKRTLELLFLAGCLAYVQADFTCEGKENNFYGFPCKSSYISCVEGKTYNLSCPHDLIFDLARRRCELREKVNLCESKTIDPNVVIKAFANFNCTNKISINYPHPELRCVNFYYTCVDGYAIMRDCPYKQIYDAANDRCIHPYEDSRSPCNKRRKLSIPISGYIDTSNDNVKPGSLAYGTTIIEEGPFETGPPAAPSQDVPQPVVVEHKPEDKKPNCAINGDGVYADIAEKCASFFWKCANLKLFKYQCPADLYYDAEINRCEKKEYVPNCGGTRPPPTTPPSFDIPPADFDCTGKADDYYVKNTCDKVFYHCNGGVARKFDCSPGLFYDIRVHQCDYEDVCRGPRTTPPPVAMDPLPSTMAPINFDCLKSGNGVFPLGKCKQEYVHCSEGRPTIVSCPIGLVLHEGNCNYRKVCEDAMLKPAKPTSIPANDVPTSSNLPTQPPRRPIVRPAPIKTTAAPNVLSYGDIEPEAPTQPIRKPLRPRPTVRVPVPVPTENKIEAGIQADEPTVLPNCAQLTNGLHPIADCSHDYMSCWDGSGHKLTCHMNLFFNQYTEYCDYKENVPGCNPGMPIPTSAPTAPAPARDVPQATLPPVVTATEEPVDPYCELLADGFYGFGCNKFFYSCNNAVTYKMTCPGGLYYDADQRRCDHKNRIVGCGARPYPRRNQHRPRPLPEQTQPEPTQLSYGQIPPQPAQDIPAPVAPSQPQVVATLPPKPVLPPSPPSPPKPAFDCKGRKDGIYALPGCTADFVQCYGGLTISNTCQKGLFYNDANGMCDYKERTPACGGTLPTTTAAPTPAQAPAQTMNCVGKADGFYALGCSSEFYSCSNEQVSKMNCPATMRFSELQTSCDYAAHVPECGGTPPTTAAPAPAQDVPRPALPEFNCAGKLDGYYPVSSCSNFYASCQLGVATVSRCFNNLFYNSEDNTCAYKSAVRGCNSQSQLDSIGY